MSIALEHTPGREHHDHSGRVARAQANLEAFTCYVCKATLPLEEYPLPRHSSGSPMTDELIERWGEFYLRHNLRSMGLRFIVFLQNPVHYAHRYGIVEYPYLPGEFPIDTDGMRPLMQVQWCVMQRMNHEIYMADRITDSCNRA